MKCLAWLILRPWNQFKSFFSGGKQYKIDVNRGDRRLTNLEYTLDFATKMQSTRKQFSTIDSFDSSTKKLVFHQLLCCYVWCTHCENHLVVGYQSQWLYDYHNIKFTNILAVIIINNKSTILTFILLFLHRFFAALLFTVVKNLWKMFHFSKGWKNQLDDVFAIRFWNKTFLPIWNTVEGIKFVEVQGVSYLFYSLPS